MGDLDKKDTLLEKLGEPPYDELLERLARVLIDCANEVKAIASVLADEHLAGLIAAVEDEKVTGSWWGMVHQTLKAERASRLHVRRARELGAESYCLCHACNSKDCPPGGHS